MNNIAQHIESYIKVESGLIETLGVLNYAAEAKKALDLEGSLKDSETTLRSLYSGHMRGLITKATKQKEKLVDYLVQLEARERACKNGIVADDAILSELMNPYGDKTIVGGIKDLLKYVTDVSAAPIREEIARTMSEASVTNSMELYSNLAAVKDKVLTGFKLSKFKDNVYTTRPFIGGRVFGIETVTSRYCYEPTEYVKRLTLVNTEYSRVPVTLEMQTIPSLNKIKEDIQEVIAVYETFIDKMTGMVSRELVFSNIDKHMPYSTVTTNPIKLDEGRTLLAKDEAKKIGLNDRQRYEIGLGYTEIRLIPISTLYNFTAMVECLGAYNRFVAACTRKK